MNIKNINTVSFQGIEGANSHLASKKLFPKAKIITCETFEQVFENVRKNKSDLGLIPVENSVAGRVAEIHSLMHKTPLKIVGEYFMKVELHLLGTEKINIKQIKNVRSHIHALSQCKKFIKKNKVKTIISADTALAAKEIREENDPSESAIASKLAAKIYNLKILKKNVEDSLQNITRFILLQKKQIKINPSKGKILTSLIFAVNNVPAALHKALGCFAINNVNMTKLESYVNETFKQAEFYVDIEGDTKDINVTSALKEIKEYTRFVRILGTYYADKFRK
ncbi:MAG: prephenate dehydratase [Alphaproteobacteria bacterium]|nr:prephenate dehydratase [Alphaproteobacteria bacterium]|tara:strand:- start:80 stop:922 length:843 start_codon:yes stop_codon:yes gene_type:complete